MEGRPDGQHCQGVSEAATKVPAADAPRFRERGEDVEQWTKKVYAKARDNARNPVQWNSEANGGFSTGTPWMRVSPDYLECNVEAQVNDPNSLFSFWKTLLALRKEHEDVLVRSQLLF